jgi:mRNA interferase YafQ
MYTISRQNRFKKDVKLAEKRGKDLQKLKEIILTLISGKELDPRYKDHFLIGNYVNTRECHIESDWLLIYLIDQEEQILHLIRTGTHSDLFKK